TGIDSVTGWWNSLTPVDLDDDGDMDYIVGNIGLNWRYKTSPESPIEAYTLDFDGNGSLDFILTYFDQHDQRRYPVPDRPRMITQIPSIQAKFNTYGSYGHAGLEQVIPKAKLDSAYKLTATTFATSWVENLGNGKFAVHPLPGIAQFSPTFGTVAEDFDGDGKMDILLTGNFYDGPEPLIPRRDAGCGLMLKGDGKGGFTPLTMAESGIVTRGDARAIATVRGGKNGNTLYEVITNSNGPVQTFARDAGAVGGRLFTVDRAFHCTHALVKFDDGHIRRYEFPTGSGYLSAGSPTFMATPKMVSATLYSGANVIKEIVF
ncbi:MAG: VCBS repeat-containing protein, partial [Candidatus Kapaibacterium sp.]